MCEELLSVEPDRSLCKWPLLTLARLREAQAMLQRDAADETTAGGPSSRAAAPHDGEPEASSALRSVREESAGVPQCTADSTRTGAVAEKQQRAGTAGASTTAPSSSDVFIAVTHILSLGNMQLFLACTLSSN